MNNKRVTSNKFGSYTGARANTKNVFMIRFRVRVRIGLGLGFSFRVRVKIRVRG